MDDFETFPTSYTREAQRGDLKLPKSRLSVKSREFVTVTTKLFNMMDQTKRSTRLIINYEKAVNQMIEENFS